METFAREDVREVLASYGISAARRAVDSDETEEIVLLDEAVYGRVDVDRLTRALMEVLPHTKVWVVPNGPRWASEPI